MLLVNVQYGSTTEMRLNSASSNRIPYAWSKLCAAVPENRAFIPIAGLARFENIDDVWAIASAGAHSSIAASANARGTHTAAIRGEDTVASSVLVGAGSESYRGLLGEGRGAAAGGAVGFGIPALLGRDQDRGLTEGGRDPVIERRGDHRRRVRGGAERAVVALQPVVVLVGGDQKERACDVEKEQPAQDRVEAANLSERAGHGSSLSNPE